MAGEKKITDEEKLLPKEFLSAMGQMILIGFLLSAIFAIVSYFLKNNKDSIGVKIFMIVGSLLVIIWPLYYGFNKSCKICYERCENKNNK